MSALFRFLLTTICLVTVTTAAVADEFDDLDKRYAWFWGMQAGVSTFDFTGSAESAPDPDIGYLRLAKMYEHFAFEVRIGGHMGVSNSGRYGVNNSFGIYLEPRIPLGKKMGLYLLGGYGGIDFDTAAFSAITGSSGSYGAGLWLSTTRRFRIELEQLRLYDKKALNIDSLTLGFTYDF